MEGRTSADAQAMAGTLPVRVGVVVGCTVAVVDCSALVPKNSPSIAKTPYSWAIRVQHLGGLLLIDMGRPRVHFGIKLHGFDGGFEVVHHLISGGCGSGIQ